MIKLIKQMRCKHEFKLVEVACGDRAIVVKQRGIYKCDKCGKGKWSVPKNFPKYTIGEGI